MAHWIIDDHGFGGQYYKCSECGDSWCDIYNDHLSDDNCPSCGAEINHDATEYIEKKKYRAPIIPELSMIKRSDSLQKYEELEYKINKLTGFNIAQLVELFAAGYTLRAPKGTSFDDLTEEQIKKLEDLVDQGVFDRVNVISADQLREMMKNDPLNGYISAINEKIFKEENEDGKR